MESGNVEAARTFLASPDTTTALDKASFDKASQALNKVLVGRSLGAIKPLLHAGVLARCRAIVLGDVRAGFAEIAGGIEPGETVVVKGVTRVVDGSKVKVVPIESAAASLPEPANEP